MGIMFRAAGPPMMPDMVPAMDILTELIVSVVLF